MPGEAANSIPAAGLGSLSRSRQMSEDMFQSNQSFAEQLLIAAIQEVLAEDPPGPDDRVPFPKEGQNLQSEDYIIVNDILEKILSTGPSGPAVMAARRMGPENLTHAQSTLAMRVTDGRSVWASVKGAVYPAIFVSEQQVQSPASGIGKNPPRSSSRPGMYMVQKRVPVADAILVLASQIEQKSGLEDHPITAISKPFLAMCGKYSGDHRIVGFDENADPIGVTISATESYAVKVPNPNYKRRTAAPQGGFRRPVQMINADPLASRAQMPMNQTDEFLEFDSKSNLTGHVFVHNAVTFGINSENAEAMAAQYTVPAMMQRLARLNTARRDEDDAVPAPAPAVPQDPDITAPFVPRPVFEADDEVEEDYPSSGDEAGAAPDSLALFAPPAQPDEESDDDMLVAPSGEDCLPPTRRKRKAGSSRSARGNRFVDDEAAGSGGSNDEESDSENDEDRDFLDDGSVGSADEGEHARVDMGRQSPQPRQSSKKSPQSRQSSKKSRSIVSSDSE